ncbi:MAG: hypothetical protein WC385_00450 [Candidatus Paceibacterota bacterium]|jgi:phenylacetate-CoA ligase
MEKEIKETKRISSRLSSKTSNFWVKERNERALDLFHRAAEQVPAYKNFLARHKINHKKIKTWNDFQKVPTINKKNYLRYYPYRELFWDGNPAKNSNYTSTTGSTGEPFYFPREKKLDWQGSLIHERFLNSFSDEKTSTLVIVAFGMGVWIGGLITYSGYEITRDRSKNKISIITPGLNKNEIFSALKKLSPLFDQTIICGYPPFVKDVVDEAIADGIDLPKLKVKFSFAAESFTEGFRDYLAEHAGLSNKYLETINVYGSADIGAMAAETPLSILARELATSDKKLFNDVFGGIEKTPTFAQFNPEFISFEEDHGEIVLTGDNTIPLIRYTIGDNGGVISFADLKDKFKANGLDLKKEATKAGIIDQITELPFVYVYERKDLSTTIYGLNVFPEFIKDALLRPELAKYCTGKMAMCTKFNNEQDQYLEINVEMKKQVKASVALRHKVQKTVLENLLKKSSEYRELYRFIGNRALPKIVLWPAEDLTFFRPGIKQKWVIKS